MLLYYSPINDKEYKNHSGLGEKRVSGFDSGTNPPLITLVYMRKLVLSYDISTYNTLFRDQLCLQSEDHLDSE